MKKLLISLATVSLVACGGESTDPELVDNAAAVSALSDDYGDALEDVPAGSEDGAAEEALNDVEDAASAADPMRDCSFNAYRERVVAQYDKDGNGKLEGDELDALRADLGDSPRQRVRWARQYRLQRMQFIYDADGGGEVSEEERAEMVQDLEARCEARNAYLLAQYDANQDGSLDASEWEVARQAMLQAREQVRAQVMAEFDANQNGTLELAERQAMMQSAYQRIVQTRTELRAQYDLNGDGVLDAEEIAALKLQLRARIRGEFRFGDA